MNCRVVSERVHSNPRFENDAIQRAPHGASQPELLECLGRMPGAFGLTTPKDLLGKLERELNQLRASPNNHDVAHNFFISAEHMLDWLYPGRGKRKTRESLRRKTPLLQVVSHLANSSKHYDQLAPHHQSVEDTGKGGGYFGASYFGGSYFGGGFFGGRRLLIKFKGKAITEFGESLPVLDVAEKVYAFWQARS